MRIVSSRSNGSYCFQAMLPSIMMSLIYNNCFAIAIAISNFECETCNTPPKRLWKSRAGKKRQDLRQYTLKVPCRYTK